MKVAVIDHAGNRGGGSRFLRALLPAMTHASTEHQFTYFGNAACLGREDSARDLGRFGIRVVPLTSTLVSGLPIFQGPVAQRGVPYIQDRLRRSNGWLPPVISGDVSSEIQKKLRGFDLAYFPWPYLIAAPILSCPTVTTIHDLNFHYYFSGQHTYTELQIQALRLEFPGWIRSSNLVTSTVFMAGEIERFYPGMAKPIAVVPLSNLSRDHIDPLVAQEIVARLGVTSPFILFPTHLCSHKNAGPLLAAISILRSSGVGIAAVITGAGSERIRGRSSTLGVELDEINPDIFGLGYVTNDEMNSLIQCASIVVNPSLYEGGNGSGLDAWAAGTPVAMSNIPPFTEHLSRLGVEATLFDPRNPESIAAALSAILLDPATASDRARSSMRAMARYSWSDVALGYLDVFRAAANQEGA